MGDFVDTEEIIAEPEETAHLFIANNGWYLLAGGIAVYYLYRNYAKELFPQQNNPAKPLSPEEVAAFLTKEEQRKLAVEKLQERYAKDALVREEKMKKLEEEKRKARMAELKRLEEAGASVGASSSGQRLGESSKKSFRPGSDQSIIR